ncbi:MAG: 1,2-phenylacetyl-CoA epoxidase subunit PaaC [Acidimicrobiales bacterium]
MSDLFVRYLLRQGDRALVLSQQLSAWVTHVHDLEEEMAVANISLDLIGQARTLYAYAGETEGSGRTEDDLAYWRPAEDFQNPLLVEQPNGDFAMTMVRQFLHDSWAALYWQAMTESVDDTLAALAGKAAKETAYHLRHAKSWVIRMGDGTEESHQRAQTALDHLWGYTDALFDSDDAEIAVVAKNIGIDPTNFRPAWLTGVAAVFAEATLHQPVAAQRRGGRDGLHQPGFDQLIEEMQSVARAHPGAQW